MHFTPPPRFSVLLVTVLLFSLVNSCERTTAFPIDNQTSDERIYTGKHATVALVEDIRNSITHQEGFKKALVASANRQFDGDFNTLLLDFRINSNVNGLKSASLLSSTTDQEILNAVLEDDPTWQLSIYNPSGETLPYDYLDDEFQFAIIPDDIQQNAVPAVGNLGEKYSLDIREELIIPTILIKKSESLVIEEKGSNRYRSRSAAKSQCPITPVAWDDDFDYYLAIELNECYIPNDNPGGTVKPPSIEKNDDCPNSDRNRIDTREIMRRWSLTNREQFQAINDVGFDYWLEIDMTVTFMGSNGMLQTLPTRYNVRDNEVKTCRFLGACSYPWIEDNQELFIWDFDISGNEVVYRWQEFDSGDETEFEIPLNVPMTDEDGNVTNTEIATATITSTNESDFIGQTYVYFCEPTQNGGSEYSYPTGFKFNIIQ